MSDLVDLLPVILIALLLWLSGLTFVFYRLLSHYRKVAKKAHEGDLVKALENLFAKEESNSLEVKRLREEVIEIKKDAVYSVQKIGITRFNPFGETGGDQSFSVCLLNGNDDGFILTALHTRDRTRVYTKSIVGGESKTELSHEEQKVLKNALNYEKYSKK